MQNPYQRPMMNPQQQGNSWVGDTAHPGVASPVDNGNPFMQGLAGLGYTGPMLGTPEFRDARQAGQTPIRDFMQQWRTDNPGQRPWQQMFGQGQNPWMGGWQGGMNAAPRPQGAYGNPAEGRPMNQGVAVGEQYGSQGTGLSSLTRQRPNPLIQR